MSLNANQLSNGLFPLHCSALTDTGHGTGKWGLWSALTCPWPMTLAVYIIWRMCMLHVFFHHLTVNKNSCIFISFTFMFQLPTEQLLQCTTEHLLQYYTANERTWWNKCRSSTTNRSSHIATVMQEAQFTFHIGYWWGHLWEITGLDAWKQCRFLKLLLSHDTDLIQKFHS